MTDRPSISVPDELVQQWTSLPLSTEELLVIAYRAGSDKELEACCEWLVNAFHNKGMGAELRAARRPSPKPPETVEVNGFTYRLAQ